MKRQAHIDHALNIVRSHSDRMVIVQIGANVGATEGDYLYEYILSNKETDPSKFLAILVEPDVHLFHCLIKNYRDAMDIVRFENVAIGDELSFSSFYQLKPGVDPTQSWLPSWLSEVGSLLPTWSRQDYGNEGISAFLRENTQERHVVVITLAQLLAKHELSGVGFLAIDAEGFDFNIIKSIPFDTVDITAILFESASMGDKLIECLGLLRERGYVLLCGGNDTLALSGVFLSRHYGPDMLAHFQGITDRHPGWSET